MKINKEHIPYLLTLAVGCLFFIGLVIFVIVSDHQEIKNGQVITESGKIKVEEDGVQSLPYPVDSVTVSPSQIKEVVEPGDNLTDLNILNTIDKKLLISIDFIENQNKSDRIEFSDNLFIIEPLSQINIKVTTNKSQLSPNLLGRIVVKAQPDLKEDEKEVLKTKKGDVIIDPVFSVEVPVEVQVLGPEFKKDFQVLEPRLRLNDNGDFEPVLPINNQGDILNDFSGQFILKQDGQKIEEAFLDVNQPILPSAISEITGQSAAWPLVPGQYTLIVRADIAGKKIIKEKKVLASQEKSPLPDSNKSKISAEVLARANQAKVNQPLEIQYSVLNTGSRPINPRLILRLIEIVNGKEIVISKVKEKFYKIKPSSQISGASIFNDFGLKNKGRYFIKSKLINNKKELSSDIQPIIFDNQLIIKKEGSNELIWLLIGFLFPLVLLLFALFVFHRREKKIKT